MKLLFLRGTVARPTAAAQIQFTNISDHEDMWVQLAYKLSDEYGELLYDGSDKYFEVKHNTNFVERWVNAVNTYKLSFSPDVLFCRGGFAFQTKFAQRFNGKKIYYGAGARTVPPSGQPWDLVLVDTPKQEAVALSRGYNAKLFIKPAADNIFKPIAAPKRYDVAFVANLISGADKGHDRVLPIINQFRAVHVGLFKDKWIKQYPNITFKGFIARKYIPAVYAESRCAVVATRGKDSCPRVIPEALACGCPLVVGSTTKLWVDKYINGKTGVVCTIEDMAQTIRRVSAFANTGDIVNYYKDNLSLEVATKHIRSLL